MGNQFSIYGIMNGAICDEGVCYENNGRYYLEWIGLGVTKRISKKTFDDLYKSELRIKDKECYC